MNFEAMKGKSVEMSFSLPDMYRQEWIVFRSDSQDDYQLIESRQSLDWLSGLWEPEDEFINESYTNKEIADMVKTMDIVDLDGYWHSNTSFRCVARSVLGYSDMSYNEIDGESLLAIYPPATISNPCDPLEALFALNREAKRLRDNASDAYRRRNHALARWCSQAKNTLYYIKGQALHYLVKDGRLSVVGRHLFNGECYAEVLKGNGP